MLSGVVTNVVVCQANMALLRFSYPFDGKLINHLYPLGSTNMFAPTHTGLKLRASSAVSQAVWSLQEVKHLESSWSLY